MNHEDENQGLISALSERLLNGIYKENPTFVLMLGMCPTLAVTTSAVNGLGMGVSTMVVLAMSNLLISLLRKVIPDKIRIPAFIVIIASFVTIVELVMKGYIPSLYNALGLYIPLIVVNCIILGRAESYAYSHSAILSLFDGFGMGMGFTIALTIIGAFRELLGSGKVFDRMVMPEGFVPVSIFVMAPGAFFVLAALTAIQNNIKEIGTLRGKDMSKIQSGCGGNCFECDKECKVEMTEPAPVVRPSKATDPEPAEVEDSNGEVQDTEEEPVSRKSLKERLFGGFGKRTEEPEAESFEIPEESSQVSNEPVAASEPAGRPEVSEEPEPVGQRDSNGDNGNSEEHNEPVESSGQGHEEPEPIPEEASTEQAEPQNEPEEYHEQQEEPAPEQEESFEEHAEPAEEHKEPAEELPESKEEPEDSIEMWNLSDFRTALKRDLPSGRRPGKNKKALEKAKAMLDRAGDASKEGDND